MRNIGFFGSALLSGIVGGVIIGSTLTSMTSLPLLALVALAAIPVVQFWSKVWLKKPNL